MARPLRVQFEGAVYHVIVRSNNRQPLFRDKEDRQRYLDLLGRYQNQFDFRIYCYLLVSRQIHLLLETPRGNVSKVMQCLGTSYTAYFNRRHKRHGTLFEGRYASYLVHKEKSLSEASRYIHRYYFRSGSIAEKKRNYPWSSYRIYLGRKASNLIETEPVLWRFGRAVRDQRRGYQQFVENDGLRERAYLRGLKSQAPDAAFTAGNYFSQRLRSRDHRGNETSLRVAEQILREVSLSLSAGGLLGEEESKRRALTRHVAMYLIRKRTGLSLRSIGELAGVKAPAVSLAIGKVEELLKRQDFSKKIEEVETLVDGSASA